MLSKSNTLPSEILEQIFAYISASHNARQSDLHACTLVSRSWYSNSITFLYDDPTISGKNYDAFVRAMCPSVNAHIRTNGLAELVRRLDMSALVHNGSKSLTARLLGRVKGRLEEFVAPQASFAFVSLALYNIYHAKVLQIANKGSINCLAALSKCTKLRRLDLSFVSESIPISDLLRSINPLINLAVLHLPRSSTTNAGTKERRTWPAKLQELHINGGLHSTSSITNHSLPLCLSNLSISNCPHLDAESLFDLLETLSPQLSKLSLLAPIPSIRYHPDLYNILNVLTNLTHLRLSVDLIYEPFFLYYLEYNPALASLTRLDLDCFDPDYCTQVNLLVLFDCLGYGMFAKVRVLGVHPKLGWNASHYGKDLEDVSDLLKALAREDEAGAGIPECEAGVLVI